MGIFHLERLDSLNWVFAKAERQNKEKADALGLRRIFPFSPIMMHVPYLKVFRKGKEIRPFPWPLLLRGWAYYRTMTDKKIIKVDSCGDENRVFS